MRRYLVLLAIVSSAVVLAVSAQAVTLTATPGNMLGWVTATNGVPEDNSVATACVANYGYAVAQRDPGLAWIAENGANMGAGAFYFTTSDGGWHSTPPTAWLGIDNINGTPLVGVTLNRISKIEFYAFVGQFPVGMGGTGDDWESWSWRIYPRQPPILQFVVENPNDPTDRRTLWYQPWGRYDESGSYRSSTCQGDNSGWHTKKWYRYEATTSAAAWDGNVCNRWYCPNMRPGATEDHPDIQWPDWAAMLAYMPHDIDGDMTALSEWKIVPTSTAYAPLDGQFMSAGWDGSTSPVGTPECTATGMPLNFVVGARKLATSIWLEDNINWLRRTSPARSYIDRFTIILDGVTTTYNFEPDAGTPAPRVVTVNSKAAWDALLYRRPGNLPAPAQDKFLVQTVGRIASGPIAPQTLRACMTDGYAGVDESGYLTDHYFAWWLYWGVTSGSPQIRENPATSAGKYWSIRGIVERSPAMKTDLYPLDKYIPIWTSPGNMTVY